MTFPRCNALLNEQEGGLELELELETNTNPNGTEAIKPGRAMRGKYHGELFPIGGWSAHRPWALDRALP